MAVNGNSLARALPNSVARIKDSRLKMDDGIEILPFFRTRINFMFMSPLKVIGYPFLPRGEDRGE
jgi:hypothetical protein